MTSAMDVKDSVRKDSLSHVIRNFQPSLFRRVMS